MTKHHIDELIDRLYAMTHGQELSEAEIVYYTGIHITTIQGITSAALEKIADKMRVLV